MNIRKSLALAFVGLGALTMSAQQGQDSDIEYVYNPNWYVLGQFGGQYTLGEPSFGKLISPTAQIGVGYNFNQLVGARFTLNAWQSKAGIDFQGTETRWKWNYIAPMVDVTFNVTNVLFGFDPNRLVDINLIAGFGVNIGYNNDEANDFLRAIRANDQIILKNNILSNHWDGTKVLFNSQIGADIYFRVSRAVKLGLEFQANVLSDSYNSKKAHNADWYFNTMVGVKYTFGDSYTTRKKARPAVDNMVNNAAAAAPVVEERIVERIVEKPVEIIKVEPMRRDIFFAIRSSEINIYEMQKVVQIAQFLKDNPGTKVTVKGYADKNTGSASINAKYAAARAKAVMQALERLGIPADRIIESSYGDTVQPYSQEALNRVAICVVE